MKSEKVHQIMPLITVILPAYNVEKYIIKCIDSLKRQTYKRFEVLMIDDGSTDSTGKLCDDISKTDKRFKVFHKKNGGLSDARNYGLCRARGELITFVDSDDFVHHEYLEVLSLPLRDHSNIEMGCIGLKKIKEDDFAELDIISDDYKKNIFVENTESAIKRILKKKGFGHEAVGKIYKKEFLKDFSFPKNKLYEDYLTTYRLLGKARKVAFVNEKMYFYVQREGSIMHQSCNKKTLSLLDVSDKVSDEIIQSWPELSIAVKEQQMLTYLKVYQRILNDKENKHAEYRKKIRDFVRENKYILLKDKRTDKRTKIKIILFSLGDGAFRTIYNRFDGDSI